MDLNTCLHPLEIRPLLRRNNMDKKAEVEKFLKERFADSSFIMEKFNIYYSWLIEENMKINLISRKTDPQDIWTHHFLDSLLSIDCVDYSGKKVLDFGTGGGFPGIPLAIIYQQSHFTLLDSTNKKIQSVKSGASKLNLSNCSFLSLRLEQIPKEYYGSFDIIVSRSVRILPEYKKTLLNLLKDNGSIVLYKSQSIEDAELFERYKIYDESNPLIGERKIIVIQK